MYFSLISVSVLLVTCFDNTSASEEFCQIFAENDNQLGFIFRQTSTVKDDIITYFLIIGSRYWKVISSDSTNDMSLKFADTHSKQYDFYTNYRMGTWLCFGQNCSTGYAIFFLSYSASDRLIAELPKPGDTLTDPNNFQIKDKIKNDPKNQFKAHFATTGWLENSVAPILFLIEKITIDMNGQKVYRLNASAYESPDYKILNRLDKNPFPAFEQFNSTLDIIGVHTMPDTNLSDSVLVLMSDKNSKITFCVTKYDNLNPKCKSDPKTFIDCSKGEVTQTQTELASESVYSVKDITDAGPTSKTSNLSNWTSKTFIFIIMIVIIVIQII